MTTPDRREMVERRNRCRCRRATRSWSRSTAMTTGNAHAGTWPWMAAPITSELSTAARSCA